jgi:hypothetical protein
MVRGIFEMYYLRSMFCAFWKCCTLGHKLVILVVYGMVSSSYKCSAIVVSITQQKKTREPKMEE